MPAIVVLDAEEIVVKAEDIAMWKDLIERSIACFISGGSVG
jgi:hypothetical protein